MGTRLYRLTRISHSDPAFFGRLGLYRFDAPDASFGVCYLGTTLACCLLEVLAPRRQDATARQFVTNTQLQSYYVSIATTNSALRLAYLADDGLAQLGIDQRHTGGDDYGLSGAWAAAIHAHHAEVNGIFYASRHHNGLYSVALFDRAVHALAFSRWGTLDDQSATDLWIETESILKRFQIAVL